MKIKRSSGLRSLTIAATVGAFALAAGWAWGAEAKLGTMGASITHIITQREAEEVVDRLQESVAAHLVALQFYEQAVATFGKSAAPEELARIKENLLRCARNAEKLQATLAKWAPLKAPPPK